MTRILSDDPLIRSMSYQSVLSAFGEGAFLTGSAFSFTRIVGLSPAQVGLGLTIGGVAVFLVWAGIVESFFSQYHEPILPYWLKITFGIAELALLCWFLFFHAKGPNKKLAAAAPRV